MAGTSNQEVEATQAALLSSIKRFTFQVATGRLIRRDSQRP